jgi:dimethylhistidine N-methyltransferase
MNSTKTVAEALSKPAQWDENSRSDLLYGLSLPQKMIHPKYLYDSVGSELFEKICEVEEYYPTRTEISILQTHANEIAEILEKEALLIEFGAGASIKTRILLRALLHPTAYVPIDISKDFLLDTVHQLKKEFPHLNIHPIAADYMVPILVPQDLLARAQKRVAFFPGSTFGNFEPGDARSFLEKTARLLGPKGLLLIGIDLIKDKNRLEQAYNDGLGITAAFNLNILARMNRELHANFNLSSFRHEARFNTDKKRIEMHLISLEDQIVKVASQRVPFRRGESIHTESSYKFDPKEFENFIESSGFSKLKLWTDPEEMFAVYLLEVKASEF